MKRAFSLVEMLIYVAIVSATFVLVVQVCLTLSRSYVSLRNAKNIQSALSVGLETMVREIRGAASVDLAGSVLGSSPGRLKLNTTYNGAVSAVEFYATSSRLVMYRDGVFQGPLTLQNVSVTNLLFRHMATNTAQAVKIDITLQTGTGSTTKTESFYDTVVLRGSYQ